MAQAAWQNGFNAWILQELGKLFHSEAEGIFTLFLEELQLSADSLALWQQMVSLLPDTCSHASRSAFACVLACLCSRQMQGYTRLTLQEESTDIHLNFKNRVKPFLKAFQQGEFGGLVASLNPHSPLVLGAAFSHLYFQKQWHNENRVANLLLLRLLYSNKAIDEIAVESIIQVSSRESNKEQAEALRKAVRKHFFILTGGPGTGKTTWVAHLLQVLYNLEALQPDEVALTATTAKAAQRLSESLQKLKENNGVSLLGSYLPNSTIDMDRYATQTLHRLLAGVTVGEKLAYRLVLVDEASMMDLALFSKLLQLLPLDTRLVLIGDPHQLPSIEAGAVLQDLLLLADSAKAESLLGAHVSRLKVNHRSESKLHDCAQMILTGDSDSLLLELSPFNQFYPHNHSGSGSLNAGVFSNFSNRNQVDPLLLQFWLHNQFLSGENVHHFSYASALNEIRTAMPKHLETIIELDLVHREKTWIDYLQICFSILAQAKIISINKQGPIGSDAINGFCSRFMAGALGFKSHGMLYHGMPLMITQNNYGLGLYNGENGILLQSDTGFYALFPRAKHFIALPIAALPHWEEAYCLTVHKAQGSEFDSVLLCLAPPDSPLLSREIIYTAVTRARRSVIFVGNQLSLQKAMQVSSVHPSGLGELLEKGWAESAVHARLDQSKIS